MHFRLLNGPVGTAPSARYDESLITWAADYGPVASIWEAEQGLVVPRTYQRYERFNEACQRFSEQAWPITVRLSGGGIVPQGPGIINLSLAYPVDGLPLDHSNAAYERVCGIIQSALHKQNIEIQPQAVSGSFCDGRYNLAWGRGDSARKVAGTAQLWRRITPTPPAAKPSIQVVLVHALILAAIDADAITARINQFENALESGNCYEANRVASLHTCQTAPARYTANDFVSVLTGLLRQELQTG